MYLKRKSLIQNVNLNEKHPIPLVYYENAKLNDEQLLWRHLKSTRTDKTVFYYYVTSRLGPLYILSTFQREVSEQLKRDKTTRIVHV